MKLPIAPFPGSFGYPDCMNAGLSVSYLWHDSDVLEVQVIAENVDFRGTAAVYVGTGDLHEAAAALSGFPKNQLDKREITLGAFGKHSAGGAVNLRFHCRDLAGHATCTAMIESAYEDQEAAGSATVCVDFDPASLDDFLLQLKAVEAAHRGSAFMAIRP
jgi:hypothetical protein